MTEKVEKTKKIQLKAGKSYSICSCGKVRLYLIVMEGIEIGMRK
tara:strand:+ start:569 stop:700 length:132 start_codon:yes stop_codon:yes gene_type:complete